MSNHVHLIASAEKEIMLADITWDIKTYGPGRRFYRNSVIFIIILLNLVGSFADIRKNINIRLLNSMKEALTSSAFSHNLPGNGRSFFDRANVPGDNTCNGTPIIFKPGLTTRFSP